MPAGLQRHLRQRRVQGLPGSETGSGWGEKGRAPSTPSAHRDMGVPLPGHPLWEREHIQLWARGATLACVSDGSLHFHPGSPRHLIFPLTGDLEGWKSLIIKKALWERQTSRSRQPDRLPVCLVSLPVSLGLFCHYGAEYTVGCTITVLVTRCWATGQSHRLRQGSPL